MNNKRFAVRILTGLVAAGIVVLGGLAAPAQADTGWNGTVAPADGVVHHVVTHHAVVPHLGG